jgi:multiple sugar transport system ATP-binding protein
VARIDLIDVCKTLTDRGGAAGGAGRGATFSIQHLNLRIPNGKTMVILGPSGCGKTTLLRLIAGLIPPDSGEVFYDDVNVNDVAPGDRRIGMVFQNYALYPHFTSRTNVLSYFLFRKKTPELSELARAKYQRTSELMGVELEYLLDRKPTTLSGGEKQRVALGRCITRDASLFLVDEPFANLDQALREKYRVNLKILLRQFDITTVYVTHDHHEALLLAHVLAVMDRGRIEQVGTPEEIYETPRNMFVAGFLNLHVGGPPISFIDAAEMPPALALGRAWVGVRPEDARLSADVRADGLHGQVTDVLRLTLGNTILYTIRVGEHEVHARTSGNERYQPGDQVGLAFERYHLFDRDTGARLRSHVP